MSVGGVGASGVGVPTAGVTAPTAGTTVAPVAGTNAPAGGMGAAAGTMATAGTGAAPGALTCAGAKTGAPAALHAAAAAALLPSAAAANGACAFSSCHGAAPKKAMLILDSSITDLNATLVGKPACEVPTLKLVDGSGGDAALTNSWLWQKLTAPAMSASGAMIAKPEWGTPVATCNQISSQMFGRRMPDTQTADLLMPEEKVMAIRDWICAGAPKP